MNENEKRRLGKVRISYDLLKQVLMLPNNVKIVDIINTPESRLTGSFVLVLEGEGCSYKVPFGGEIPIYLIENETKLVSP